jgi:hypothetical protein
LKVVVEGLKKAGGIFHPQEIFLLVSQQPVIPWINGGHREI